MAGNDSEYPARLSFRSATVQYFIYDFLFAMKSSGVCNFVEDETVYECGKDGESMARRLEEDNPRALDWFQRNRMVANLKKFQVMFLCLKQIKNSSWKSVEVR